MRIKYTTDLNLPCRCGDDFTYQVSPTDVTTQEEEEEEVRSHLPLSAAADVTVECVSSNHVGVSRQVFHHRKWPLVIKTWVVGRTRM